ncbi:MAG: hypothetical protein ACOWWO_18650 [Peptococcaceae bacterium]
MKVLKKIQWRSIISTIIIFLSNLIEGYANFLITLALNIDNGRLKAPEVYRHLSETEILALTERSKVFDPSTGKVVIREKAYMRTSDKIRIAPFMLECLYNQNATLMEKRINEYQQLIKLQCIRDSFMHVKHDIHLLPQSPMLDFKYHINNFANISNYQIDKKDLFESMNAVAWYLHKQFTLIRRLFHVDKLSLNLMETKIMFLQISLNKVLKIRNSDNYSTELIAHRMVCIQDFVVGAPDDNSGVNIQLNENKNENS